MSLYHAQVGHQGQSMDINVSEVMMNALFWEGAQKLITQSHAQNMVRKKYHPWAGIVPDNMKKVVAGA